MVRDSYWDVLCKKAALEDFPKFTAKQLARVSFDKVAGCQPATLLKRDFGACVFMCVNFTKCLELFFYRTPVTTCCPQPQVENIKQRNKF